MLNQPRVAVIILSFNGLKDLRLCLPSVIAAKQTNHMREIIVVDNNSTDGSLDYVSSLPDIKVMSQRSNLGFAAGNNVAIKWAMDQSYDFAVLLNQDTIVELDWLNKLIDAAQTQSQAGAIQSLLTLWPNVELVNSWGNQLHYLGFGYAGGNGRPVSELTNRQIHSVTYPSGAAVLLRLSVLQKIGLLDEFLNTYHEDLELGWRMMLNGYQVLIQPASIVHHHYEFKRSINKFYFMERNRWLVILAYWKVGTLCLLLPMLLVMEIGQLLFSIFNGYFIKRLKVYYELLKPHSWQWISAKRRQLSLTRRITDRQILNICTGRIEYQELASLVLRIINPIMALYLNFIRLMVRW